MGYAGRTGQAAKVIMTRNNNKMVSFSLAFSKSYKEDDQWKNTEPVWMDVQVLDPKLVEKAERIKKGEMVEVHGELVNNKYKRKDGKIVDSKQIKASNIILEGEDLEDELTDVTEEANYESDDKGLDLEDELDLSDDIDLDLDDDDDDLDFSGLDDA